MSRARITHPLAKHPSEQIVRYFPHPPFRSGAVLVPPFSAPPQHFERTRERVWVVVAISLLLPMFFEAFHYIIDTPLLYLVSKAWPVLVLPFTLFAAIYLRPPYAAFFIVLFTYMFAWTPLASIIQLKNTFLEAIITTNKAWTFSYYFAMLALLHLLQPSQRQIRNALAVLSIMTFVVLWFLWLLVPSDRYVSDPDISQLFFFDEDRGYRIPIPIELGLLGVFVLGRTFCRKPHAWHVLLLVATFASLLLLYKERVPIASAGVVLLYSMSGIFGPRLRLITLATVVIAAFFWGGAHLFMRGGAEISDSLGGSLSVRMTSAAFAYEFIRDDPLRWLLGVGATTRQSATQLQDILGFRQFFTTDIGWLGVVMEYGLIGSVLIAAAYILALREALRAAVGKEPWVQALADFSSYLLLTSAVYSVVYKPGVIATIAAIAVYCRRMSVPESGIYQR